MAKAWGLLELILFVVAIVFTVRRRGRGARELRLLADWALCLAVGVTTSVVFCIVVNAWESR